MIDQGEAVLAMVGIRPIISRETEKITAPQFHEAADLDGIIERQASKLARGELPGRVDTGGELNYDRMLRDLAAGPSDEQLDGMLESFPPERHHDAASFIRAAHRALDYLKAQFPISVDASGNLPPPSLRLASFENVLAVLDKPLSVFDLIDANALLGSEVKALEACFPTFLQAVTDAIEDRIVYEQSRVAGWAPPFAPALAKLRGTPPIDPKTKAALGAAKAVPGKAQQQAAAGGQKPGPARAAEQAAPPSQKDEASGNALT